MYCRVLGNASGKPELSKYHASLHVILDRKNYLIDTGEGVSQQVLRYNLGNNVIDDIIISHLHPDHSSGIFMLLQLFYLEGRTKPLTIYLPERIDSFRKSLNLFYIFLEKLDFQINFKLIEDIDIKNLNVLESNHLEKYSEIVKDNNFQNKLKSYSFQFEGEKNNLIYTSDINDVEKMKNIINDKSIVIIDALHSSSETLFNLFLKYSKTYFYLNHGISDELDKKLLEKPLYNVYFTNHEEILKF